MCLKEPIEILESTLMTCKTLHFLVFNGVCVWCVQYSQQTNTREVWQAKLWTVKCWHWLAVGAQGYNYSGTFYSTCCEVAFASSFLSLNRDRLSVLRSHWMHNKLCLCDELHIFSAWVRLCFDVQIFEKALDEPKYSSLYAQLCHRLCDDAPNFEPPSSAVSVRFLIVFHWCNRV